MAYMRINDGDTPFGDPLFGPGFVDVKLREAINFCWVMLPDESRTTSRLAEEMRRILERAIKDIQDDERAFSSGE
jgi:hypothetical protein